jgi:4-amino-4-deoxy-L-arabinose transferase-like glycosyltransferase
MKKTSVVNPYLIILLIMAVLISPYLFFESMFMDGLIYAGLSKNLSLNIGTFWKPHFSKTSFQNFYEHPPLALYLESIVFKICGYSKVLPKIYSISTFILVGILVTKIWKLLSQKNSWIPLLVWLLIPIVRWATWNNLLENTMSIFTTLALLFYLTSKNNRFHYLFMILSGLSISLAFLTKGFVSLFPLMCPFLYWIIYDRDKIKPFVLDTLILILSCLAPIILLIYKIPSATNFFTIYFKNQVLKSINNITTVDSRFFIIKSLLMELITPFVLVGILLFINKNNNLKIKIKTTLKSSLFFFLLGSFGAFPIMISLKQSDFYIIATYPFFAISLALLISPFIKIPLENVSFKNTIKIASTFIAMFLLITCISSYINNNTIKQFRLSEKINNYNFLKNFYEPTRVKWGVTEIEIQKEKDVLLISNKLKKNTTIFADTILKDDIILQSYFVLEKNISLNSINENQSKYKLTLKENIKKNYDNYTNIRLDTKIYALLKKNN